MRGNQFGKLFSVTSFGESHGPAMGAIIDGMPPGLLFDLEKLKIDLQKRAPGQNSYTSARDEKDTPQILSGIFEGKTLGTPIAVLIANTNQKSEDYNSFINSPRPGHADQTTLDKYGIRDHRGGGRASGRETISRVIAGHFAQMILPGLLTSAKIIQIGTMILPHLDAELDEATKEFLTNARKQGESYGGKIELTITHVPKALGEPCFDKLKADLAKAMLSIGSCMGIVFGPNEDFASIPGTQLSLDKSYFGGIEGGISNGDPIILTLQFKAPSTIGEKAKEGRHDPCILPRVIAVVEAMAKIVIADHYLRQRAYI